MQKPEKDFRFNRRAASYDEGAEGRLAQRFYRLLKKAAPLSPNDRVLDIGCGTGMLLRILASSCPIQGYGVDMEPNMVAQAQKKCPEMDIRVSSCAQTPFESETFDALTACLAFHHFSDKQGFAKEAARLLKPSGRLYIADPLFPFAIRKTINGILRLLRVTGWFGTPDEIYGFFAPHGFELADIAKDRYAQVVVLRRKASPFFPSHTDCP